MTEAPGLKQKFVSLFQSKQTNDVKPQLNQYRIEYFDNKGKQKGSRMFNISEDDQKAFEKSLQKPQKEIQPGAQTLKQIVASQYGPQTGAFCLQFFTKACKNDTCHQSHDVIQLTELIKQSNKEGKSNLCKFHFQKKCTNNKCLYSHKDEDLEQLIKKQKYQAQKQSPSAHQFQQQPNQRRQDEPQLKQTNVNSSQVKYLQAESPSKLQTDTQPKQQQICKYFFQDGCTFPNCPLSHDKKLLFNIITENQDNKSLPQLCKFHFVKKNCKNEICEYTHDDKQFEQYIQIHNARVLKISSSQYQMKTPTQQPISLIVNQSLIPLSQSGQQKMLFSGPSNSVTKKP